MNRRTGIWSQDVVITNTTTASIAGGFAIQLENLSAGATLVAAGILIGNTTYTPTIDYSGPNGPRILIPQVLFASLPPGGSLRLKLQFTNPLGAYINFNARIFSDPQL